MNKIHAASLYSVSEWKETNDFMKGIDCTNLQVFYCGIKYDSTYQNFTAFYNKINESYRILIEQKIIKPVSIIIMKIKYTNLGKDGNSGVRGGRGRG